MSCAADGVRAEVQQKVRDVVALAAEDSRKAALAFAARVLNLPFDRVRRLFYGQARRIEAHEADQIRAYVEAAHKLIEARAEYEAQKREFLAGASPFMARLVPPALERTEVSEAAQAAVDVSVAPGPHIPELIGRAILPAPNRATDGCPGSQTAPSNTESYPQTTSPPIVKRGNL